MAVIQQVNARTLFFYYWRRLTNDYAMSAVTLRRVNLGTFLCRDRMHFGQGFAADERFGGIQMTTNELDTRQNVMENWTSLNITPFPLWYPFKNLTGTFALSLRLPAISIS
ncbi:hypothetical protein NPIL_698841 [Nephila pilipes]|uniref:Uncharacterized protein n=1 Tax=Nephila pilipes TaxID=299642 RepID=A0A8X6PR87_NEPPI|nr:hypothetical protein NPIL_698841 [Nephila pilipes]